MSEGIELNFNKDDVKAFNIENAAFISESGRFSFSLDGVTRYLFNPKQDLTAYELHLINVVSSTLSSIVMPYVQKFQVLEQFMKDDFKKLERHFEVSKI